MSPGRGFRLLYVLPTVLLLLAAAWPLVSGDETLFLRDLFNTHLEMKWLQAEALGEGRLPLIDPYRAGGQPHLGNPNTVPLYPDNLLYLVAPLFWAFNAHLWLHLLLAPAAFYALARAWGLEREPAWAAAVLYAGSGFYLSNLNFYNLVAGVTLAPALIAAALRLTGRPTAGRFAALGLLWTLLLLAGDPMTAALAALLAATAVAARHGRRARLPAALAAVAAGTLLAAPQLIEFLRVAPQSFRGYWGYSAAASMAASWPPLAVLGWLVPFPFGQPDLQYWGQEIFQGHLPFYFSLYPGALALVLISASGRPRGRAALWGWGLVAGGLFFALGVFNPPVRWLAGALPANLLRLPAKLWPAVAIGAALLCGLGFARLLAGEPGWRRRLAPAFAGAYLTAGLLLWLGAGPAAGRLRRLVPARFDDTFVATVLARWITLLLGTALLLALLAAILRAARRRPRLAGALVLAVHLATQLLLLRPLLATDETAFYRADPPLAARIPPGSRVAHGANDGLFGPAVIPVGAFPDASLRWRQRQMHAGLYPATGMMRRLRYELNLSPEGLDSFLTRATTQAFGLLDDADRVRLLAAFGVDYLILEREPEAPARELLEPLGGAPVPGGTERLYRLRVTAPEVRFVGRVRGSDSLNEALARLLDPDFDPRAETVLAGPRAPLSGAGGTVEILARGPESLRLAGARRERRRGGGAALPPAAVPRHRRRPSGAARRGGPAPAGAGAPRRHARAWPSLPIAGRCAPRCWRRSPASCCWPWAPPGWGGPRPPGPASLSERDRLDCRAKPWKRSPLRRRPSTGRPGRRRLVRPRRLPAGRHTGAARRLPADHRPAAAAGADSACRRGALRGGARYRVQWLTPNKLSYPLLALAWLALPPLAAARLATALVAGAWVLAVHWLAARRRRPVTAAALAGLLLFNHVFYLGLFNFVVGWRSLSGGSRR